MAIAVALNLTLMLSFFSPAATYALDGCTYKILVGNDPGSCFDSSRGSVAGAAFPSFSDAFNSNPASIPTIPTPYGIELIGATLGNPFATNSQTNFALIKGFQNIGTGIASNSDKTFFSPDLGSAFIGTDYEALYNSYVSTANSAPSFNFGSALGLALDKLKDYSVPTLGLGLRYNRTSDRFDIHPGFSLNSKYFHVGFSQIVHRENQERYISSYNTDILNVGFRLIRLSFDLTSILPHQSYYNRQTVLYVLSYQGSRVILTVGRRDFKNIEGTPVQMNMFAGQARVSHFLSLGYLYNYIPGSHSFVSQFIF